MENQEEKCGAEPFFSPTSHSLNVGIATTTKSVNAALIFNHLFFWIKTNCAKGINQYDNRTWMYETIPDISLHLPYLSEQQVKDGINILVKHGYLLKGNFSKNKFDHTNWYAVAEEEWLGIKKIFSKRSTDPIDMFPRPDPSVPQTSSTLYTDSKTDNKREESAAPPTHSFKKEKKPKEPKTFYRSNISLTAEEHIKLLEKYGKEKFEWMLDYLEVKKGALGKNYDSDYHVLLPANWVNAEYEKQRKEKKITPSANPANFTPDSNKIKALCEKIEQKLFNKNTSNIFFNAGVTEAILVHKPKDMQQTYRYEGDYTSFRERLLNDLERCFPGCYELLTGKSKTNALNLVGAA